MKIEFKLITKQGSMFICETDSYENFLSFLNLNKFKELKEE